MRCCKQTRGSFGFWPDAKRVKRVESHKTVANKIPITVLCQQGNAGTLDLDAVGYLVKLSASGQSHECPNIYSKESQVDPLREGSFN